MCFGSQRQQLALRSVLQQHSSLSPSSSSTTTSQPLAAKPQQQQTLHLLQSQPQFGIDTFDGLLPSTSSNASTVLDPIDWLAFTSAVNQNNSGSSLLYGQEASSQSSDNLSVRSAGSFSSSAAGSSLNQSASLSDNRSPLEQTWIDLHPGLDQITACTIVDDANSFGDRQAKSLESTEIAASLKQSDDTMTTTTTTATSDDAFDQQSTVIGGEVDNKARLKRMRNTESARQSRRRKVEKLKTLETEVEELQLRNRQLERDNIILKAENGSYNRRIDSLEKQIAELHGVLSAFGVVNNNK